MLAVILVVALGFDARNKIVDNGWYWATYVECFTAF